MLLFLSSSFDACPGGRGSEVCRVSLQEGLGGGCGLVQCVCFISPVAHNQVKSSKLSSSAKRSAEVRVHVRVFSSCALYIHSVFCQEMLCLCVYMCVCAHVCMCRMHLGMVKLQMLLLRRNDRGTCIMENENVEH